LRKGSESGTAEKRLAQPFIGNFQMLRLILLASRLRRREKWTRDEVERYREEAVKRLREYAYANSPFYQRFHKGLFDAPLKDLPVLTKRELMSNWDEIVTDRNLHLKDVQEFINAKERPKRFKNEYVVTTSGGTSGRPAIVVHNSEEWLSVLASYNRVIGFENVGVGLTEALVRPVRPAMVTTTYLWHHSSAITATVQNRFYPVLRIDTTEPMEEIVARLNAFQPRMLSTYPSVARLLAVEQIQGRLHISPEVVSAGAEALTGDVKEAISRAWGVHTFNSYVATETGAFASECPEHRGLHLFEDLVLAEFVDENNQPAGAGQYSAKVLVTVLFSRTLPLIRYELEDSVRMAKDMCPCGRPFPLIDDIQGRIQEVIHLEGKSGGLVAIQPIFFHVIMESIPSEGWQVVQESRRSLRISVLHPGAGLDEAGLKQSITSGLVKQGAVEPSIELDYPSSLQRTSIGKVAPVKAMKQIQ
jgi:phenylacetate-CoA ligase